MNKQHRERYADGTFKDTRARTDLAYRERQRRQRAWISEVSERLGEPRERLVGLDPDSVAEVIRHLLETEQ